MNNALDIPIEQKFCSIEAIIFDLDGTLYPQKDVKKAMIRSFFPRLMNLKKYACYRNKIVGKDFGDADSMKADALAILSNGNKKKSAKWNLWLKNRYYPTLLSIIADIDSRPGFVELVQNLYKRGITMAIVSDYGYVNERLVSLGFDPKMFFFSLGTEDIGAMKPAKRINDLIRSELKINPAKTLVVGDRADTDKALADEAGMFFMGISDSQDKSTLVDGWYSWDSLRSTFNQALLS